MRPETLGVVLVTSTLTLLAFGALAIASTKSPAPEPSINATVANATLDQLLDMSPRLNKHLSELYKDYKFAEAQLLNFLAFYACDYDYGFANGSAQEAHYVCPPANQSGRPLSVWLRIRWGA